MDKKRVLTTLAILTIVLTSCGQEQLTSAETCSELKAIVAVSENFDDMNEEEIEEASDRIVEQIGDLSEVASDPLAPTLETMYSATATAEDREGLADDPEALEEYTAATDRIDAACDMDS